MWEEWLKQRLPLNDVGDVYLRCVQSTIAIGKAEMSAEFKETIELPKMIELFSAVFGTAPPADDTLPEETYQALLSHSDSIGSSLWRQYWEQWRVEGRI